MRESYSFSFNDIRIVDIMFHATPNWKKGEGDVPLDTSLNIEYSPRGKKLLVRISLSNDNQYSPFTFMVAGIGFFEFEKMPNEEILETVARVNCAAIMFPYIREVVADLTSRAGLPPFHHSPVNFHALYEEYKAAESEELEQKPPAPGKRASGKKKQTKTK
ncbi:MAG: protein-export chaperone SecB [bacterium]|nr:protein-export chaperone SecB [bacterium]MDT8365878.1 protein-export chaperone SecB [bacterium]